MARNLSFLDVGLRESELCDIFMTVRMKLLGANVEKALLIDIVKRDFEVS